MKKNLLQILSCPVTHKGLSMASAASLQSLNRAIEAGSVTDRGGDAVASTLQEALVTDDGKLAYPIEDGMPVLLENRSIDMEQLG